MEFLNYLVLGNTVTAWLVALVTTLAIVLVLGWINAIMRARMTAIAMQTPTGFDDGIVAILAGTKTVFLFVFALFFGSLTLEIADGARSAIATIAMLALIVQGGLWAAALLKFVLQVYAERQLKEDAAGLTTMNAVGFLARLALWVVVLLVALDNLGVDITALVTGLGIGGIAVALALQNVLADLFASLTIVLDKPFVMKDFLAVNEFLGSVEHVGLKTTRLRSLSGEQLIFSNADLLGSRIRNYGRMYERRVVFSIGVVYQTPREKLIRIPEIILAAIESQEQTRFDRAHFKEYGPYSLNFEAVYYVLDPAYVAYMDKQQAINLNIHEQFETERIEFAYPSQTIYVTNAAGSTA
jgi:small-conductance mechanosensitive channel